MLSLTFSVRLCVRKIRLRGCVYLGPSTGRVLHTHPGSHSHLWPCPLRWGGSEHHWATSRSASPHTGHCTQGGSSAQRLCSMTAPAGTHTRMPGAVRYARPRKCWPSFGTSDMYNDSESHDYASWHLRRAAVCQARVSSNSLEGRHFQISTLQLRKLRSGRSLHPQVPKSETMRAWEK